MWKHLTTKTGIPVPAPDKREVGGLTELLLPKGNIFIFAHTSGVCAKYEGTLNLLCFNPTSNKQCCKAGCTMKIGEHRKALPV